MRPRSATVVLASSASATSTRVRAVVPKSRCAEMRAGASREDLGITRCPSSARNRTVISVYAENAGHDREQPAAAAGRRRSGGSAGRVPAAAPDRCGSDARERARCWLLACYAHEVSRSGVVPEQSRKPIFQDVLPAISDRFGFERPQAMRSNRDGKRESCSSRRRVPLWKSHKGLAHRSSDAIRPSTLGSPRSQKKWG